MYTVPEDDLVGEILIPAMSAAASLRCMAAFFNSSAFGHLAPGLAAYINSTDGTFRLLISPSLSDDDRAMLQTALAEPESVLARAASSVMDAAMLSPSAIERHTLECLAYLAAKGRLSLRFVLMPGGGMFHPKVWLFQSGTDLVAAHGSSNATTAGLLFNFETVSIERSWMNPDALDRASMLNRVFDRLWSGEEPATLTLDLPAGLDLAERLATSSPPTVDDFWRAWHEDAAAGLAPPLPLGRRVASPNPVFDASERLTIPTGLQWQHGPFGHQGRAVAAWEAAEGRGLLSMATGSGKTLTSLICATRLQDVSAPLLIVVAAPFRPLVEQWSAEVASFGVTPLPLGRLESSARTAAIRDAIRRLERDMSQVEIAVITHDFLVSDPFYEVLDSIPAKVNTLLIADEVHNLGRPKFVERPPEAFIFRLGLSATPVLQYNEIGTDAIAEFFGPTVFQFSLADAIGVCLVPYNYHLHPVPLAPDEEQEWEELTAKLVKAGFRGGDDGSRHDTLAPEVLALLVKRRAVLEAAASKVGTLISLLTRDGFDEIEHTLVYCSDKRPEQLIDVNRSLLEAGVYVRQITAEETGDRRRTAQILEDFGRGDYQVLTCKRVLDEGVDIPQVRTAYLLASSTVRRQWVQRRGRILRRCDAIEKKLAHLHDFLVVPTDQRTQTARAILRQELDRGRAFAELAANAGDPDGPFATMSEFTPGD